MSSPARTSVEAAIKAGVPVEAIAFYARWFQLENWLRTIVYLELRARDGEHWAESLARSALQLQSKDSINDYMRSPDAENPLAYLDAGTLLDLLDDDQTWPLFEPVLLPRVRWRGLVDELHHIRNRTAHCRRPHPDDLSRLEQTLRDLEPGARRSFMASAPVDRFVQNSGDPVAERWIDDADSDADYIVRSAAHRYGVRFSLWFASRPWAAPISQPSISGVAGHFYIARLISRERVFDATKTLQLMDVTDEAHRTVVHIVQPDENILLIALSAVDNADSISEALYGWFDAALDTSDRLGDEPRALPAEPDWRLEIETPLAKAMEGHEITVFGG
jgi:hypothetical protein